MTRVDGPSLAVASTHSDTVDPLDTALNLNTHLSNHVSQSFVESGECPVTAHIFKPVFLEVEDHAHETKELKELSKCCKSHGTCKSCSHTLLVSLARLCNDHSVEQVPDRNFSCQPSAFQNSCNFHSLRYRWTPLKRAPAPHRERMRAVLFLAIQKHRNVRDRYPGWVGMRITASPTNTDILVDCTGRPRATASTRSHL